MFVCVSKYKLLESRLEETVQQAMKIKEGKISNLEKKLEESNTRNATLQNELATVSENKNTAEHSLHMKSVVLNYWASEFYLSCFF